MKRIIKKICLYLGVLSFTLIICTAGYFFYLYNHREFKPNELEHKLLPDGILKLPTYHQKYKKEVEDILNQPFSYLGLGKQMTVYESADQKYVLKLFNPRSRLKERWFHDYRKLKYFCSLKWLSSAF